MMKEISSLRKAVALLLMVMLGQVAATAAPKKKAEPKKE